MGRWRKLCADGVEWVVRCVYCWRGEERAKLVLRKKENVASSQRNPCDIGDRFVLVMTCLPVFYVVFEWVFNGI